MIPSTVVTIVLAAGRSGRLGAHKALLRFGEKSAIARVVESSLASKSNQTMVVLGAQAESVRNEIADLPVSIVENAYFPLGRTGSLKCALHSLIGPGCCNERATAIIIFPVDCPFVPSSVLNGLIDCLLSQTQFESVWIAPEYQGKRGHPVLLFGPVLSRLLELSDDFPLRDFLHSATCDGTLAHLTVTVDTEGVLDNINTTDDLARVLKREGLA